MWADLGRGSGRCSHICIEMYLSHTGPQSPQPFGKSPDSPISHAGPDSNWLGTVVCVLNQSPMTSSARKVFLGGERAEQPLETAAQREVGTEEKADSQELLAKLKLNCGKTVGGSRVCPLQGDS
ncbi:hypothetical protein WMY93_005746 [Mugilogobius chulae]|uniref:Uncharacterized protein n=1 Tax=Mugilogobius chulae TaxID=88201 RepID=A0AAW0PTX7_9GOBI